MKNFDCNVVLFCLKISDICTSELCSYILYFKDCQLTSKVLDKINSSKRDKISSLNEDIKIQVTFTIILTTRTTCRNTIINNWKFFTAASNSCSAIIIICISIQCFIFLESIVVIFHLMQQAILFCLLVCC